MSSLQTIQRWFDGTQGTENGHPEAGRKRPFTDSLPMRGRQAAKRERAAFLSGVRERFANEPK